MIKKLPLLILLSLFFIASCNKKVKSDAVVYTNDFESSDLSNITNGVISRFNNTAVLGQYNNDDFFLTVGNLPDHDLISVSFDLYIHDSWDGNKQAPDGPDIWSMYINGSLIINTTFSNITCAPGDFCLPQSYPQDYPNNYNNPKTGAYRTNLPGVCSLKDSPNGTTWYKITKTFRHSAKTFVLQCQDRLVQTNSADAKCDESWSVDNITVKAISL